MSADAAKAAEPDLLAVVEDAIARLQAHPDPDVRAATSAMLEGIDAVHRAGLSHLVGALRGIAGDALINKLIADPAIRLLLMSYDLVAVDRRLQAEEALDTVRGHLHGHGLDLEIQEVVGGVVYVRLHANQLASAGPDTIARAQADIASALRAHFIGFQEVVFGDRHAAAGGVVPLAAIRRARRPVSRDACAETDLPGGAMRAVTIDEVPVLLARVDGEVYAVRDRCGDSPLPLHLGVFDGEAVTCSWHGCRYDMRSGRRLDADGRIQVFPVSSEGGRIKVAVDTESAG